MILIKKLCRRPFGPGVEAEKAMQFARVKKRRDPIWEMSGKKGNKGVCMSRSVHKNLTICLLFVYMGKREKKDGGKSLPTQ